MSVQYPVHLTTWIKKQLETFLGYPDDGQLTAHLLSFPKKQALAEYTMEIIGDNKAVAEFTAELWRRKTGEKDTPNTSQPPKFSGRAGGANEEKKQPESFPRAGGGKDDLYSSQTNTSAAAMKARAEAESAELLQLGRNVKVKHQAAKHGAASGPITRTICHCQATTHQLFTNCTACGKIVCEAEGEGPCLFCGSMVTQAGTFVSEDFQAYMKSMEPLDVIAKQQRQEKKDQAEAAKDSSTADSLTPAPTAAEVEAAGLAKAEAQRNKLLGFASDKKKASQIFDAQNDWYEFESNSWLSKEARAEKQKEAEAALLALEKRKGHTLTIDLENKKIVHHDSDAWKESLQSQQNKEKWTDPTSSSSGSGPVSRGMNMAAAQRSKQGAKAVEEMKVVSKFQYFHNDTLTGRAKEVYADLKASLRASSTAAIGAGASTSAIPASKPASTLLAAMNISSSSGFASMRGAGALSAENDVAADELDGLSNEMSELELEERLAANREKMMQKSCGGTNDEDEPTNCGGALNNPCSNLYPDETDKGMCLSMWQPWAYETQLDNITRRSVKTCSLGDSLCRLFVCSSLLVLGIKRFEGRGWFTPYRGRLWIASGSRETTPEEIAAVEAEYREVYGPQAKIPFPSSYPQSALLGCVDLTGCWSAEEFQSYRANNGAGGEDSQSQFVFVCQNPRILPLPQSHSGQHKLYSLPPKLYQALGPALKPVSEKWRLSLPEHKPREDQGFDLWPPSVRPASVSASAFAVKPSIVVLEPGMLLLKQALSLQVQQSLIDCVRHIGLLGNDTGFTTPTYKDGPSLNLKMLCLGWQWSPNTNKYERMNERGKLTHPIPEELLKHVEKMINIAVDYLKSHGAGSAFPAYVPDICIVNYYSASSGKLGIHQDKSESSASIKAGYPVVSFSIGDSGTFLYGHKRIPDDKLNMPGQEKYKEIVLASGDVLLFGGPARGVFHGIEKILPNTKPRDLFMKQGRLNLTFRKL